MIKPHTNQSGTVYQVYGRVRVDGTSKKVYVGSFPTPRLAAKADEEHKARQRMVADGELPEAIDNRRTLGASLDKWIDHLRGLSPDDPGKRSLVTYESRIRNHVPTALQATALAKVNRDKIEKLQANLKGTMSATSVNGTLAALSSAFNWFMGKRWIGANPVKVIKPLKYRPKAVAESSDGYRWFRDLADVTALLAKCSGHLREIVAVLVGAGLRIDEALHLRSSDVDLANKQIKVRRGRQGPTKSGRARVVPIMSESVRAILTARVKLAGRDGWLWPGTTTDTRGNRNPLAKQGVQRAFERALKRAGLDEKINPHDLRHTFASHFMMGGGDIFRLSRILGHSSVQITERTYAHLRPDVYAEDFGRVAVAMP